MFKSYCFAILFLFSFISHADELPFFDTSFGDFSEELNTAGEQEKKGVLIMFGMDDCPFCHRMKTTILNKQEVIDYFRQHFLVFYVDIEGDIEITDFDGTATTQKDFAFEKHRVRATPVFIFFDLQGEAVARYTGATSSTEEFLWLGEYVSSGKFNEMNFVKFKREKQKNAD